MISKILLLSLSVLISAANASAKNYSFKCKMEYGAEKSVVLVFNEAHEQVSVGERVYKKRYLQYKGSMAFEFYSSSLLYPDQLILNPSMVQGKSGHLIHESSPSSMRTIREVYSCEALGSTL